MIRINSPTAVNGKFVKGNPTTGQKATQFTEEWCNHVQEEIINAIGIDGTQPDPSNKDQLAKVIKRQTSVGAYGAAAASAVINIPANTTANINTPLVAIAANTYDITVSFFATGAGGDLFINVTDTNGTAAVFNGGKLARYSSAGTFVTIRLIMQGDKSKKQQLNANVSVWNQGSSAVTITNVSIDCMAFDHI